MTSITQLSRRDMIETLARAGAAVLLTPAIASATSPTPSARRKAPIFTQELPPVSLDGWKMTALDITYAPGEVDHAHRHIGFVFGFVIEGALRFKADGGEETVYHAGAMFYEPPGTVHRVSANASTSKPVRFLAMVFAGKSTPLTVPV
ncbi:MAG: cupin domain-containing protein [Gemmatimonadaceae bacterium]|nr:cupin domain-containing protein [Gemmatimonadaceae bacterium]